MISPNQTFAIVHPSHMKAAALLFDRIWVPKKVPLIRNYSSFIKWDHTSWGSLVPTEFIYQDEKIDLEVLDSYKGEITSAMDYAYYCDGFAAYYDFISGERFAKLARELTAKYSGSGITATPYFDSSESFSHGFPKGNELAIASVVSNVPVVNWLSLLYTDWKQIHEFRLDQENLKRFRRFRLWLYELAEIDDPGKAIDVVAKRLEDYQDAMRKHGIETTIGTLKSILSKEGLIAAGLGSAIAALGNFSVTSIIAGSSLAVGKAALSLAEILVDYDKTVRREHECVAYIHSMNKEFGKDA